MRVLRIRGWPFPTAEGAMTSILREQDLKVPIEQAQQSLKEAAGDAFASSTIFEMSEDSNIDCINQAVDELDSVNEFLETNMAILFHYTAQMLDKVGPGPDVFVVARRRAPLALEYVTDVLRQLKRHSKYKGQTIFAVEQDGNAIAMRDGDVISLGKYVGKAIESMITTQILYQFSDKIEKAFKEKQ